MKSYKYDADDPASSDSGLAVALAFAERGCEQIYLGDSSLDGLRASSDAIRKLYPSVQVHIDEFDRANEEAVDKFFSKVKETFKRIDFAVNIISQGQETDVPTGLSVDGFDRNYQIYQRGVR